MSVWCINGVELIFRHLLHLLLWKLYSSINYNFDICVCICLNALFIYCLGLHMLFIFWNYDIDSHFLVKHVRLLWLFFRLCHFNFISLNKMRVFLFRTTSIINLQTKIDICSFLYFVLHLSIHKIFLLPFLGVLYRSIL